VLSHGNCTFFVCRYDEQQLLGEIEKRLGGIVGRMGPDLSLPPDVAERLNGGGGGGEVYGQAKGGGVSKEVCFL